MSGQCELSKSGVVKQGWLHFVGQQNLNHGRHGNHLHVRHAPWISAVHLVGFGREGVVLKRKLELVVGMLRRGHPAFHKVVSHRQPACPPQLERKQPYFVLFLDCRLPGCLPRRERDSTRTMAAHHGRGRLPIICVGRPDLHLVSCSRRGLRGSCLGNVLSRAVLLQFLRPSAGSWPPMNTTGLPTGRDSPAGSCLLRRMCFAVETEDRFLPMPRPSTARPVLVMGWR